MQRHQRIIAALFLVGPLGLVACGDDLLAPPVEGPSIPRDGAKPKSTDLKSVSLGADGALVDELSVGAKLRSDANASYALLTLEKGSKFSDASDTPISSGELEVNLDSYNSNLDQGLKLFTQQRTNSRVRPNQFRGVQLEDVKNKVGAVQVQIKVDGKVVNQSKSSSGDESGVSLRYCSPSLAVFRDVSVAQAKSASEFDVFNSKVVVNKDGDHHCVVFALPKTLHATATLPAGFVISGN